MKLTVLPAITPAIAWPIVGSLVSAASLAVSNLCLEARVTATKAGLENMLSFNIRR